MPKKTSPKTQDAAPALPKTGTPEYYEEVLYSIPEGIMVFDGTLKLKSANRAAHELAMLSAEAMGKTAKEAFFKGNQGLTGLISRTLSSGRPHTGFTTELIRPDATMVPVEASASPIEGPDGQTLGVALSLREASRLRELEEAIKKSERLAYLGTMAASVAHELRNPLGGIKGASRTAS